MSFSITFPVHRIGLRLVSFNFCYWQWKKVDEFVIIKPREFEMSNENYLNLII